MYLIDYSYQCNLSCSYCYNREVRSTRCRPDLEAILGTIESLEQGARFCLHGGEPLTWGVPVLRVLFEAIRRKGSRPTIQTNLTLLDPEILNLLGDYGVSV